MVIQVCGTGSGVGKSVMVSAFCRIFLQDGYRVCPFKAQNMALNSYVTRQGGEIGRAQATQAQAARIEPSVDMNPILMKPMSDRKAQIIVRGRAMRNMSVYDYVAYKKKAKNIVRGSFRRLAAEYDAVVIEGAGSPAEINLKAHDIVNMQMAEYADAPVVLVGDIDKGGVFAWFVGTLALLTKEECRRVKGFIINKFRGDKRLLRSGIEYLQQRTGKPVLGVIPYFKDIKIPEEDSVPLEKRAAAARGKPPARNVLDIAVINMPHLSNFTDFDALENEPDVSLRYVSSGQELASPDVIIIPGTKHTLGDLRHLKRSGLAERIQQAMDRSQSLYLVGICGGYQMLGSHIYDRHAVESTDTKAAGLGFLPVATVFEEEKMLSRVQAEEIRSGLRVSGYEIHHGFTRILKAGKPVFRIRRRQGKNACGFDGAISPDGRVWGTYLHGVFDEDEFRRDFLNRVRLKKGWDPVVSATAFDLDKEFDKLAALVRKNIDMRLLYAIARRCS